MNEQAEKELKLLVERRWDPRCGKSRVLGKINLAVAWVLTAAIIVTVTQFRDIPFWVIFSVCLVLQSYCWLLTLRTRVTTITSMRRHNGFLCPWCRYALTGLVDDGVCPECGVKYRRTLCEQLYACAYEPKQPDAESIRAEERRLWREAIELRDGVIDE